MYTRHHSPVPPIDPWDMLVRYYVQDLERDIERIHLERLARATRPRHEAPLRLLLRGLRSRLPRSSRSLPVGAPPAPAGELAWPVLGGAERREGGSHAPA
jgi:hypothetical protein